MLVIGFKIYLFICQTVSIGREKQIMLFELCISVIIMSELCGSQCSQMLQLRNSCTGQTSGHVDLRLSLYQPATVILSFTIHQ